MTPLSYHLFPAMDGALLGLRLLTPWRRHIPSYHHFSCLPLPSSPRPRPRPASSTISLFAFHLCSFSRKGEWGSSVSGDGIGRAADSDAFSLLTAVRSEYNEIVIVETANSRFLLLDSTHNTHSLYNKGEKWTRSYWDEFASLPAIIPEGPVGMLGLGGGTAAHLMLELWPSLTIHGWEIDGILIDKARQYLGLHDLEKCTEEGGILHIHIGDALCPSASVPGGFAGIVVDLFADGKVLEQLQEVETWLEIGKKLMPQGCIMVNCGGAHSPIDNGNLHMIRSPDLKWIKNSTMKALCEAFPGNLSWIKLGDVEGENYLALTGPTPNLNSWAALLPSHLSTNVKKWRPCS